MRIKRSLTYFTALLLFCGSSMICNAQSSNAAADESAQQVSGGQLDKLAIQESIAGYLIAINAQDAQRAASYWSDSGEWIAEDGTRIRGRSNIAVALAESFASDPPGMNVSLRDMTLRMVTPTVAIEDGMAVITAPDSETVEATYSVVHVKTDTGWKIDTVRETNTATAPSRISQLESLSWLVGDWSDQINDDLMVETSCRWTEGNNSLRRSFRVTQDGQVVRKGTQVILWDARLGKIRSWMFDSDGGFGNGIWEQQGPLWVVDSEFQLADGGVAGSTNVYTNITDSQFEFQSVNRTIDGVAMDDTPVLTVAKMAIENNSQTNSGRSK